VKLSEVLTVLSDYQPQRVYLYAQTLEVDTDVEVKFSLLLRARQIVINRYGPT
jgi:hypothetical protein